jgi:hypothetical protein
MRRQGRFAATFGVAAGAASVGQRRTIDFYRCLRPMQDRFVAATLRTAPPAPLLFRSAPRTTAWVLLAASALLAVVAILILATGWGDVSNRLALHDKRMIGVDIALFAASAYCFVHAATILRSLESLQYPAGLYVFPACVIDASGPKLRVWSINDATAIERLPEPALALRMDNGESVRIPVANAGEVERLEAALNSVRPQLQRALAEDDADVLAEFDPLHQSRVSSPISSTEALTRFSPLWMRLDWALAACVGLTLGLALSYARNATSDDRMYGTVVTAASIPQYAQYLARGGRRSEEVRDVLLARAELYEAQRLGTPEALQEFVRTHPTAKIGPEIDAAMRRILLVELDKARAIGTVTAVDEFAHKYPGNLVDAELKAARHVIYAQALAAWKQKTQPDAPTSAFFERLAAVAEKSGASCEVHFRLNPSKTFEDMEKRMAKHAYYPGPDALPSHYLTAEAMRSREQSVAQSLVEGFAAAFPADVLSMHAGEPLAATAAPPPGVPALVIDYAAEWSNALSANDKPRTLLAAIRFDFDVRFVLPEGAPLHVSVKSGHGPEPWRIKGAMSLHDYHTRIYDMVIDRAFDELQKKLANAFFR